MLAEAITPTRYTLGLLFPVNTEATPATGLALGFLFPVDTEATTATGLALGLLFSVLANALATAGETISLPLAMRTLLANPHGAEAVHKHCCGSFVLKRNAESTRV